MSETVTAAPLESTAESTLASSLRSYWLGEVEYGAAWQLQRELVTLRQSGAIPDSILFLTHPKTITLGRSSQEAHLLASREDLAAQGFSIYDVDRGGDVTYHGPGQLVGYPIFDLADHGKDLHRFLRLLEETLIDSLAHFGIRGRRFPPHTGVWVDSRKIAAIGIKVSRWVTSHGFALNVGSELGDFGQIVPCGIREYGVTSIAGIAGLHLAPEDLIPSILLAAAVHFELRPASETADSQAWKDQLSPAGQKILRAGIDASKNPVIDYAPLSGDQKSPGAQRKGK